MAPEQKVITSPYPDYPVIYLHMGGTNPCGNVFWYTDRPLPVGEVLSRSHIVGLDGKHPEIGASVLCASCGEPPRDAKGSFRFRPGLFTVISPMGERGAA